MSISSTPRCTSNSLADVVRWVKEERAVCLIDSNAKKAGLVYHQCVKKKEDKQEKNPSLADLSVVMVDLCEMPEILGEGEWPDFLKEGGLKLCECQFAQKIAKGQLEGCKSAHSITLKKTWITL